MNIIKSIAPYINEQTSYLVVILLIIWALCFITFYIVGTQKASSAFRRATKALGVDGEPVAFAERFETIRETLQREPVLSAQWKDYARTLAIPSKTDRPVYATAPAEDWFNLDILRSPQIGLDPRFHAIFPSLLVGAGLLFTFLGLAVALSAAGGIVEGNAADRNSELKHLLDTASFKFTTSLVGLFLSVAYTLIQKWRQRRTEQAIDGFVEAINARILLRTPVSAKLEANDLLERQLETLQSFSNDLAVSLGETLDTTFNQRLGEHIEPLTEAITSLAERMSSGSEEALKTMLDGFVDRLQGGAGAQVNAVAENLSGLGSQLSGLQSGFSEAAVRMASSADAMANRMSSGAEAMQSRIDAQAEANALRLTGQIEAMVSSLAELARTSRSTGEEAIGTLAAQIAAAARGFEATASRVSESLELAATSTGGALGKGAEAAVDRIAAATEGMRTEMQAMIAELKVSLGQAGETLREGGSAGGAALQDRVEAAGSTLAAALTSAADRLTEAGNSASGALERGGDRAAGQLSGAGEAFAAQTDELARQSLALAASAHEVGNRFAELDRATRSVIEPLLSVSSDLRAAGVSAQNAASPLVKSAEASAQVLSQVAATAQQLEAVGQQAGNLIASLNAAAQRFEGVDKELTGTIRTLQEGLQGFTTQISTFVGKTDSNMTQATQHLANLVKELQATIEDFTDAQSPRKG